MKKNKIALLFLLAALLLGFFYFFSAKNSKKTQQKVSEISKEAAATGKLKKCSGEVILELTEGPYYKSGSPEKKVIYGDGTAGRKVAISGFVYDTNCNPIKNAWLDFWQADGNGNYDNEGYNFRGHQFTDSEGKYNLETKMPGDYSGRTAHIHVKVRADKDSKTYTTQLYFPTGSRNNSDSIFDERLLVKFADEASRQARFDFVIDHF